MASRGGARNRIKDAKSKMVGYSEVIQKWRSVKRKTGFWKSGRLLRRDRQEQAV